MKVERGEGRETVGGAHPTGGGWGRSATARWAGVLVAVVTLVAMGRLCGMDFSWWDDSRTIHHNPLMNPPSWETVQHYWTHAYMGLYVPVTYMVWAALAAIARVPVPDDHGIALNPWVFHTANVLVHVCNALLVYAILRRVVRRPWAAAAGAMVFGAHPVQVEAVGWVSGMKDLLCGLFVLGAVWNYLVYAQGEKERDGEVGGWGDGEKKRRRVHYWVGAGLMVLGMLSKPTAVVTPWLVGVLDVLVVGRDWRRVARSAGVWVALTVPCLVWAKVVQTVPPMTPVWARPGIAGDAVAFYLWKVVWPARLMVDYGRTPPTVMARWGWWMTAAIPVGVGVAAWLVRRRRPVLLAAFLVFVVGVAPVLGFTPFEFQYQSTTADHYLYLSMLGVALAAAYGVSLWPGKVMGACVGVIVAVLAVRSAVQAGVWRDNLTLFGHELALNPASLSGHIHMAIHLEDRAVLDPNPADQAALLAEAERHLRLALPLDPEGYLTNRNLGMVLIREGRTKEAIGYLERAIPAGEADPRTARDDLGFVHYGLGAALWQHGRRAEAVAHFEKAVEYDPASEKYARDLAVARQALKRRSATTSRPASAPAGG